MANWLQKFIYLSSNAVPLLVIIAIIWQIQLKTWTVPIVLLVISIVLVFSFILSFSFGMKHLSRKTINVSGVESQDSWMFGFIVAYLLPFGCLVIKDYNKFIVFVVLSLLVLVGLSAVVTFPNFWLFVIGYHFYKLEMDGIGMKDILLISKKKRLRSKKDVRVAIRMFEKILIDTSGDR